MNIRHLRYFVTLAQESHFGHASQLCHVTQPTLSEAVRQLEHELAVALIDRKGQRFAGLTPGDHRVMSFASESKAIALTNGTAYSLAAAVWTRDVDCAHRVSDRIKAGTVWINTYGPTDTRLPWGGMGGESGIGRDLGGGAIDKYTEQKVVWLQYRAAPTAA